MIDLQCPNNAGGIAALNSHGKSLTQEQCWPWFVANFCKPAPDLRDKFHGMLTPNAGWLDGDWNEVNARTNVLVYLWSFFSSASVAAKPAFLRLKQDNGPSSTESEFVTQVSKFYVSVFCDVLRAAALTRDVSIFLFFAMC